MSGERIEIPLTLERTNPKFHNLRRYSTGRIGTFDTGEQVVNTAGEQVLPHYLIASTNTCHEICKYGVKPASEEMRRHSLVNGIREKLVESQTQIRKVPPVETKSIVRPKPSSDRKIQVSNTPKIVKQGVKIIKQEASSSKKIDVAAKVKPTIALKLKPVVANSSSSPLTKPSRAITGRRNSDVKVVNNAGTSKIVQKKALELPRARALLSPKPSLNRVASLDTKQKTVKTASPLKDQKKVKKDETKPPNNEKVIEKTLYIIEPKPEEQSLTPSHSHMSLSSLSSCSSSFSLPLLLHEGEGEIEEDKELSQKLNFRSAKKVNLESDNNDSRRLTFSTGAVIDNSQNVPSDIKQKSFTKREVGSDDTNNNDKPETENVVLRHQDMEGKKDAQGLFNNVIEETASKLVETKKSKVKALVGAFETVISLQESKPFTARRMISWQL